MADEGLDGDGACRRLDIRRPLGIMLLAGLSCPFPGSEDWDALVAFCARYCRADVVRLRALLVRYKQLPGPQGLSPLLEGAMRHGDDAFMARPLVRWQTIHAAGDDALGANLAMSPRRLGLLAYYRRPEPGAVAYPDEVRFLSGQSGCDAARLDALLIEVAGGRHAAGRCRAGSQCVNADPQELPAPDPERTVLKSEPWPLATTT